MTEREIKQTYHDKDINRILAEKVMEWRLVLAPSEYHRSRDCYVTKVDYSTKELFVCFLHLHEWQPYDGVGDAFRVIAKLREQGWMVDIQSANHLITGEQWRCEIHDEDLVAHGPGIDSIIPVRPTYSSFGNTPSQAICYATLLCIFGEEDRLKKTPVALRPEACLLSDADVKKLHDKAKEMLK